ncbi:hypothetical protein IQ06DRAFT_350186 [Phaeosphaeriaceae sp. SRC1lsM3a]|nr:hypothetical protein IQ06DRAFT_350186 [Stagonospora sp. SRC1lsM3a]
MRFSIISASTFLLAAVNAASIVAKDANIVANWSLKTYTDGACTTGRTQDGGNTPKGCTNLATPANSYKYSSSYDPNSGVQYSLIQYAGLNCVRQVGQDDGNAGNACSARTFESYKVVAN